MQEFPHFLGNVPGWIEEVIRIQGGNAAEANNYPRIYQRGRRTNRVPTTPTDVLKADAKWDVVNNGTYEFTLVDVGSGVLKWDRRTLSVAW